jgi:hypothetical protein
MWRGGLVLTAAEEEYIRKNAKVPEHIPALMVGIAQADPFISDPFFGLVKDDWLIFIGYPLTGDFSDAAFSLALEETMNRVRPNRTWLIAPEIPDALLSKITCREDDFYYRLDLHDLKLNSSLIRTAEKAARDSAVSASRLFSEEHMLLTGDFLRRQVLPPRIHQLYLCMKDYLSFSETSLLLSVRDRKGRLSAYYVLELGAADFLAYIVGCHSQESPVPHASDLLFFEMIALARERRKKYIHLGLGVNAGISRFKGKWGGVPFLKYEFGEISTRGHKSFSWIDALGSRL